MKIKRFQAETAQGALEEVRRAFGPEAVILDTRRRQKTDAVTGRVRRFVEVVAAVDFDVEPRPERPRPERNRQAAWEAPAAPDGGSSGAPWAAIAAELHELRALVKELAGARPAEAAADPRAAKALAHLERSAPLLAIHQVLTDLGVPAGLHRRLAAEVLNGLAPGRPVTREAVLDRLHDYIGRVASVAPRAERAAGPCRWVFVGPTGVGKTTTLAKIAARLALQAHRRGVLVSLDTYRLGGVEQLRRYAALMEIPMEVAHGAGDLRSVMDRHADKDFVLVDTTGRSPRDPRHRGEMAEIFGSVPSLQAQVVLSATTKEEDLRSVIDIYRPYPVSGWILSKLDETRSYGSLCTPVLEYRLPISYLATGQRVPEDLRSASRRNLARLLLRWRGGSDPQRRAGVKEIA
ncbi:flagellar biosynthesis protein FlhF [Dissulfurirhabdus thermomarina]|uniref:Flagellar biosynthesis protein FlhF n=1 Tax=Dissulfurirhabdus thermomarina TaxID=1765737 RepID=A0A6N9TTD6_DISTH|nr:flagellar biosynthesis protein FlhF [Dissulfurirhabdus thermomarina]NDY42707.1 flagellar biosynthesis protein FlhF [Dissulfurirhabdus thermomarina]NMX24460.1 flagellar biosynthesis protein FlhF [Dissulfurirhabdus thermomarina]